MKMANYRKVSEYLHNGSSKERVLPVLTVLVKDSSFVQECVKIPEEVKTKCGLKVIILYCRIYRE
jgi:hypothetical protein